MNVYVAGKWSRRHEAAALAFRVMDRGHDITHHWWNEEDPPADTELGARREFYALCAAADVDAVLNADAMILLHDAGCRGAFVELGIALADGVRVIVIGGGKDPTADCPIFYFLPEVEHVATPEAALEALDAFARAA